MSTSAERRNVLGLARHLEVFAQYLRTHPCRIVDGGMVLHSPVEEAGGTVVAVTSDVRVKFDYVPAARLRDDGNPLDVLVMMRNGYNPNDGAMSALKAKALDIAIEAVAQQRGDGDVSTCPWCGLTGPGFDQTTRPADYCDHAAGKTHTLKTDPDVFQAVLSRAKTFEIRLNDREYAVGDTLCLRETLFSGAEMRQGQPLTYTGRECRRTVSHILTGYGLADGWCCLSFAATEAGS